MSRRSLLPRHASQQRAASRMTPGTRMWSEQPNPVQAQRGPVTEEPDVVASAVGAGEVEDE